MQPCCMRRCVIIVHSITGHLTQFLEKVGTRHVVIDDSYELGAVIKLLVESKQHRVYVLDNEHKPVHVISLSDVLVACAPHMHSF